MCSFNAHKHSSKPVENQVNQKNQPHDQTLGVHRIVLFNCYLTLIGIGIEKIIGFQHPSARH
jgi:hypothetical protein